MAINSRKMIRSKKRLPGFTVPPENPRKIAEGLKRLAALSAADREKMGTNGQRYVREHHDFSALAEKFLRESV